MANRQPQRQTLAAAVFAACLTMSIAAQAQEADADAQPAASEDQPTTLATMTVPAQKREEALQDVPISVTVLDQQLFQDQIGNAHRREKGGQAGYNCGARVLINKKKQTYQKPTHH